MVQGNLLSFILLYFFFIFSENQAAPGFGRSLADFETQDGGGGLINIDSVANSRPKLLRKRQRTPAEQAAIDLKKEKKAVDRDRNAIEKFNGKNSARVRAAAKDALKQEAAEDKNRAILAANSPGGTNNPVVASALAAVKDNGPSKVVAGFKEIKKHPGNVAATNAAIKQIDQGRIPVIAANKALIKTGGGGGGGRRSRR